MAHGYTSVPPGDANTGWFDWRARIEGVTLTDFFNKFAAQSGDMARCNRLTVMAYRGHNSFSFDLVESYGFEGKPAITVTVTLGDDVRFQAFLFSPQSNDDAVETRNWLCAAHAWTRQQFGARNMFKISDTCPLLPDPEICGCSPCWEMPEPYTPPTGTPMTGENGALLATEGGFVLIIDEVSDD